MGRQRFIVSLLLVLNVFVISASLQEAVLKHQKSLSTLKSSLQQGILVKYSPPGCGKGNSSTGGGVKGGGGSGGKTGK